MKIPDLNDLIADLQTAKQIAIDDRNPNAIVTATVAQAKLLGMDNMRDVTPNSNIKSGLGHFYNREPEPIANRPTVIRLVAGVSPEAASQAYKNIMG